MRRRDRSLPSITAGGTVQQIASRAEQNLALSGALSSANQKLGGRCELYFSVDCDNVQVGFTGYYLADVVANTIVETNVGNAYTVRCSLEYNGQSVLFSWGGQGSRVVADGEPLALSDKLKASAFGLSKFTKGDQAYLRMERVVNVNDHLPYHYANVNSPTITGERYFFGALTATDQLLGTGDWLVANGWSAHGVVWLPTVIVGKPLGSTKRMASVIVGASIEHGAGETGRGDGFNLSGGYIRRGFVAGKGAKIGMMRSDESALSFLNNSVKRRALWRYANVMYTAHGGNDYTYGQTTTQLQASLNGIWALARAAGIKRIHHLGLSVKTDSTDGWTTEVNQTPRTGFEIGGNYRDVINTWAAGLVGTTLDAYDDLDTGQAGVSRDKWRVDLGAASTDGTHPTSVVHTAMGTDFEGMIEADRVVIEV